MLTGNELPLRLLGLISTAPRVLVLSELGITLVLEALAKIIRPKMNIKL